MWLLYGQKYYRWNKHASDIIEKLVHIMIESIRGFFYIKKRTFFEIVIEIILVNVISVFLYKMYE